VTKIRTHIRLEMSTLAFIWMRPCIHTQKTVGDIFYSNNFFKPYVLIFYRDFVFEKGLVCPTEERTPTISGLSSTYTLGYYAHDYHTESVKRTTVGF